MLPCVACVVLWIQGSLGVAIGFLPHTSNIPVINDSTRYLLASLRVVIAGKYLIGNVWKWKSLVHLGQSLNTYLIPRSLANKQHYSPQAIQINCQENQQLLASMVEGIGHQGQYHMLWQMCVETCSKMDNCFWPAWNHNCKNSQNVIIDDQPWNASTIKSWRSKLWVQSHNVIHHQNVHVTNVHKSGVTYALSVEFSWQVHQVRPSVSTEFSHHVPWEQKQMTENFSIWVDNNLGLSKNCNASLGTQCEDVQLFSWYQNAGSSAQLTLFKASATFEIWTPPSGAQVFQSVNPSFRDASSWVHGFDSSRQVLSLQIDNQIRSGPARPPVLHDRCHTSVLLPRRATLDCWCKVVLPCFQD